MEKYNTWEVELKPCPFCGCEAKMSQKGQKGFIIKCLGCAIQRTQKTMKLSTDWLMRKMIEHWNNRETSVEQNKP